MTIEVTQKMYKFWGMTFRWPDSKLDAPESLAALRQSILEQIFAAKSGHPGGSLSMVEILVSIFSDFQFDPKNVDQVDRDRFVLSKGHGVPAYYSLLSRLGFFEAKELVHLRQLGHFLQGHPDHRRFNIMEASTGSLGQGASIALGLAMGLRQSFMAKEINRLPKVFCVLGDGELQEGQVWECLMAAGKFQPGNLIFILDYNKGQIDGPVAEVMDLEPIVDKVKAFKWNVQRVDGHSVSAVKKAIDSHQWTVEGTPTFIVADTVKGKGVSFMEDPTAWHGAAPNKDQLKQALAEIAKPFNQESPFGRLIEGEG